MDREWDGGAFDSSLIDRTLGSDRSSSVVQSSNSGVDVDEESVSSAISDTVSLFGGSEASGGKVLEPVPKVAVEVPVLRATGLQLKAAWQATDAVEMSLMFQNRLDVMRSVRHFPQGPFRNAMLMALEVACLEGLRKERGWKLFMLLPRLLLHKQPRGGNVPRQGEVSAGRQALEGAALAPGNMTTLNELRNPYRRPVQPTKELPR